MHIAEIAVASGWLVERIDGGLRRERTKAHREAPKHAPSATRVLNPGSCRAVATLDSKPRANRSALDSTRGVGLNARPKGALTRCSRVAAASTPRRFVSESRSAARRNPGNPARHL